MAAPAAATVRRAMRAMRPAPLPHRPYARRALFGAMPESENRSQPLRRPPSAAHLPAPQIKTRRSSRLRINESARGLFCSDCFKPRAPAWRRGGVRRRARAFGGRRRLFGFSFEEFQFRLLALRYFLDAQGEP